MLSATLASHLPQLRAATRAVREATHGRIPIAIGGQACGGLDADDDVDADIRGGDAAALIARAGALLAVRPMTPRGLDGQVQGDETDPSPSSSGALARS